MLKTGEEILAKEKSKKEKHMTNEEESEEEKENMDVSEVSD